MNNRFLASSSISFGLLFLWKSTKYACVVDCCVVSNRYIMAAPKGNQFWKIRSKHGRDKLFETPELLWIAATEYFEWVDETPLKEEVIVKKKVNGLGEQIIKEKLSKMRPYTLSGLCIYLGCSTEYFRHFEKNNKNAKDFMPVITRIREVIYAQKFEGAAAGLFNANIISRDLGLADKKELQATVKDAKVGFE